MCFVRSIQTFRFHSKSVQANGLHTHAPYHCIHITFPLHTNIQKERNYHFSIPFPLSRIRRLRLLITFVKFDSQSWGIAPHNQSQSLSRVVLHVPRVSRVRPIPLLPRLDISLPLLALFHPRSPRRFLRCSLFPRQFQWVQMGAPTEAPEMSMENASPLHRVLQGDEGVDAKAFEFFFLTDSCHGTQSHAQFHKSSYPSTGHVSPDSNGAQTPHQVPDCVLSGGSTWHLASTTKTRRDGPWFVERSQDGEHASCSLPVGYWNCIDGGIPHPPLYGQIHLCMNGG